MLAVCLQDTARFIALAGTEFTGIDALPETVVDSTPVGAEQTGYRNPYAVYGETPAAAGGQLDDAPNAAPSPKRRAEERCAAPLPLCLATCCALASRTCCLFECGDGLLSMPLHLLVPAGLVRASSPAPATAVVQP